MSAAENPALARCSFSADLALGHSPGENGQWYRSEPAPIEIPALRASGPASCASKKRSDASSTACSRVRSSSCSTSRGPAVGTAKPASSASRSTASGKLRPSVSITNLKMSPFWPDEKSNQEPLWSLTKNEGVRSCLKGERPFISRPARFSATLRATTWLTGSRRGFHRAGGGKRMGFESRGFHRLKVICNLRSPRKGAFSPTFPKGQAAKPLSFCQRWLSNQRGAWQVCPRPRTALLARTVGATSAALSPGRWPCRSPSGRRSALSGPPSPCPSPWDLWRPPP